MKPPLRRPVTRLLAVLAGTLPLVTVVLVPAANADGSGSGAPTVVTLGDSYISGEAGRWAGNTNGSYTRTDALGDNAYWDNASGTGESIEGCHRSRSAEAFVGDAAGINLACSGARTVTDASGSSFKPGIDFYDDGAGNRGQAAMLRDVARTHNVRLVVLSIGGNDFNFASIVQSCITDFLASPSWYPDYCKDDSSVVANFTAANVAAVTAQIAGALGNVRTAMTEAGYSAGQYSVLVQTYPSPIPNGSGFRYSQFGYTRQSTGGCGFWNADADWANGTLLPTINGAVRQAVTDSRLTNAAVLELSEALTGRRLCEGTVGLLEEKGLASWTSSGAVDQTEWIEQVRTVSTIGRPYYVQESLHPDSA